jgi:hypothetical protein
VQRLYFPSMEADTNTMTVDKAKEILREHVNRVRAWAKELGREGFKHAGNEDLVLSEGCMFDMSPLPKGFKAMKRGLCFMNAQHMAEQHQFAADPLYYCEGFAILGGEFHGLPVHHAWVVKRDGTAFDPTWHKKDWGDGAVYIGIPFTHRYALRTIAATGLYGVLGDGNGIARRHLGKLWRDGLPKGAKAQVHPCKQSIAPVSLRAV